MKSLLLKMQILLIGLLLTMPVLLKSQSQDTTDTVFCSQINALIKYAEKDFRKIRGASKGGFLTESYETAYLIEGSLKSYIEEIFGWHYVSVMHITNQNNPGLHEAFDRYSNLLDECLVYPWRKKDITDDFEVIKKFRYYNDEMDIRVYLSLEQNLDGMYLVTIEVSR
jgi:hypothetical protein